MPTPHIQLPGGRTIVPGKIVCVGRNYVKHVREMKSELPTEPVLFLKPPTALVRDGGTVVIPQASSDVHHEVELVSVIGKECRNMDTEDALEAVAAYAVGVDMTARDLQTRAKNKGLPWAVAKGFDTFAPLGDLVPASQIDPANVSLELRVNDTLRQQSSTSLMIFPLPELIAYCSSVFTLLPGDLIYTGTPDGVGPVTPGDTIVAQASGMPPLHVAVSGV
jgi:2-keto-4-pentenoate hydratase/2-oxohepta-3-ene-1,7-dioic acid hydratase in catechol pathway